MGWVNYLTAFLPFLPWPSSPVFLCEEYGTN
jgi:hypothetical protein